MHIQVHDMYMHHKELKQRPWAICISKGLIWEMGDYSEPGYLHYSVIAITYQLELPSKNGDGFHVRIKLSTLSYYNVVPVWVKFPS